MQLAAYGSQDMYLTANPEITMFKAIFRRHSNFAMESIEQTLTGNPDFGKKVTALVSRSGDLMHRVYLQVDLPEVDSQISGRWTDDVGHHLINSVEVEIGGQRIDRQTGDWLQIWSSLTVPENMRTTYNKMIGKTPDLCLFNNQTKPRTTLYIPLQFWFCRNIGLSLPLIALQYHEVKINIEFKSIEKLWINYSPSEAFDNSILNLHMPYCSLWVDYIYLDTDERRRFAQAIHEYLIEQIQYTGEESINNVSNKIRLSFNHPTKELIWVVQKDSHIGRPGQRVCNQWSNYQLDAFDVVSTPFTMYDAPNYGGIGGNFSTTTGTTVGAPNGNPVISAKLQLNSQDRFAQRAGSYFNLTQIYQHHSVGPQSEGINVYSFAATPESYQPSGSVNFSRIDNATLQLTVHSGTFQAIDPDTGNVTSTSAHLRVYAVNYNVLRIMSGMGGLAYSN
ncbi:MAG: major capsid protein [candidate division WOR-3 bacterium]